ncbi:alpha/beta hydrolase [Pseudoalteromonas sp. A25]|uniref:alpha/beta fold hydrolase n=1 Tax=Pseudoalteromonas sp. A25 TaxID=116092 RepID=UPI0012604480|nr:alpha/beta hydrolase [Pseudoalteromonas sp. A25]BBN83645.1 alpha/beta hydrolase [Pseudoalteromonas sp. A25]
MNLITKIVLTGLTFITVTAFANNAEHPHDYKYVQVNENKLAYLCKGEGETTALLIAGMGLDAHGTYQNTFHNAQPKGYRLCFYDRAGTGRSTFAKPRVRTMLELTKELELFTQKTNMKQLVLVPHSFGGLIARAFAHRNPDKVKGLVLVDTVHESWYEQMKGKMSAKGWGIMKWIIDWERDEHSLEDFVEASQHSDIYTVDKSTPVTVLSRGIPHVEVLTTGMSYDDVDVFTNTWNESQQKFQSMSSDVNAVTMKYASHLFDKTDPFIVLKHIDEMVGKTKT